MIEKLKVVASGHQSPNIPLCKPPDVLVTHGERSHLAGTAHEQGSPSLGGRG